MVAFIKLLFTYLADAPKETVLIMVRCHDTCRLKWFDVDCWQKWTLVKGGWVELHLPTLLSSTFWVCKLWLQDNQGHYIFELLLNCKLQNILCQLKGARMWGNAGSKGTSNFCFTLKTLRLGLVGCQLWLWWRTWFLFTSPTSSEPGKEAAEKRVLVCVCREESGVCVCARTCGYMCVGEGNGGQRFSCVCMCACIHMCVLVRQEKRVVCVRVHVCVLGREMKDGGRVFQRQNLREFAWGRKKYFGLILFSNHHN